MDAARSTIHDVKSHLICGKSHLLHAFLSLRRHFEQILALLLPPEPPLVLYRGSPRYLTAVSRLKLILACPLHFIVLKTLKKKKNL